eukprot:11793803-Karenia_brevis.AAC.1
MLDQRLSVTWAAGARSWCGNFRGKYIKSSNAFVGANKFNSDVETIERVYCKLVELVDPNEE